MLRNIRHLLTAVLLLAIGGCSTEGSRDGEPLDTHGRPPPALAETPADAQKMLLIGGESGTGLAVLRLALERGHWVSVLAPRPETVQATHERLQVFAGDLQDPERLARIVAGHDVMIVALPAAPRFAPTRRFSDGMRHLLEAMRGSGAGRLVAITNLGVGGSLGHGGFLYDRLLVPVALAPVFEDREREEELVRMSHTEWTIVRPAFLSDAPPERRYRVIQDLEGVTAGRISRADVAHFVLAAVEQEAYVGWTVLLSN